MKAGLLSGFVEEKVMQDKVRAILDQVLFTATFSGDDVVIQGKDAAAEAIATLPVDRVQAMAMLVHVYRPGLYGVPGCGVSHLVDCTGENVFCDCDGVGCEHIQAVELWLERESAQ